MTRNIFLLFVLFQSGVLFAQVATPSLIPAMEWHNPATLNLKKMNNATIAYAGSSGQSFEGAAFPAESEVTGATGLTLGFNYLYDRTCGIDVFYESGNVSINTSVETKTEETLTNIGLGCIFFESLSVAVNSRNHSVNDDISGVTLKRNSTATGFGATVGVYGFFFGYSAEPTKRTITFAGNTVDVETTTAYTGVAYSYGSPRGFQFRIEFNTENDPGDKSRGFRSENIQSTAVELVNSKYIFGYQARNGISTDLSNLDDETRTTETDIRLGVLAMSSFHYLFGLNEKSTSSEFPAKGTIRYSTAFFGFGYSF